MKHDGEIRYAPHRLAMLAVGAGLIGSAAIVAALCWQTVLAIIAGIGLLLFMARYYVAPRTVEGVTDGVDCTAAEILPLQQLGQ
jgi:hypothetical protein